MTPSTRLFALFAFALVSAGVGGAALAEDQSPACHPTEALFEGQCIHKTKCPAGMSKDGTHCIAAPNCDKGTRWLKAKNRCVKKGEECGSGLRWVPQKNRCVVLGAECGRGLRWIEAKERCVVKGAECKTGMTWVPRKNRCVVKGTECGRGLRWDSRVELCRVTR